MVGKVLEDRRWEARRGMKVATDKGGRGGVRIDYLDVSSEL